MREIKKRLPFILRSIIYSIVVIGIAYAMFAAFGMNEIFSVHFGVRNFALGTVVLAATQIATGRLLTHRSWWPGVLLFELTQGIYSWTLIYSAGTAGMSLELFRNYFLGYLGLAILLFFLSYFGSVYQKIKPICAIISAIFLLFGYLSLFSFIVYFSIFNTAFTPADMISILESNIREEKEFVESHLSTVGLIGGIVVILAIFVFALAQVKITLQKSKPEKISKISLIVDILIIIAALITSVHWVAKCFPLREYFVASSFLANERKAEVKHSKNVAALQVDASHKEPGTIIVVIGESETRDHMKAFNPSYPVDTTPWLTSEKGSSDFFLFPYSYTNFTKTAEALSMYMTGANQYNHKTLKDTVTISDVAKKAGYQTYCISNQNPSIGNVAMTIISQNSDKNWWVRPPAVDDMKVLDFLKQVPATGNQFVVIHIQGSHDKYKFRYPENFPMLHVEGHSDKENEYDTSVAYTDKVLKEIYTYAKDNMNLKALFYCSDHGEDMTYFHGSSKFTWPMDRVGLLVYLSSSYQKEHPSIAENLRSHEKDVFTNDLMFDLISGVMNVPNSEYESKYDISSSEYSLTKENALTMHGKRHISEDPELEGE